MDSEFEIVKYRDPRTGCSFTWDDRKAELNVWKHSVTFELASEVFSDPFYIIREDFYPSETRFQVIGKSHTSPSDIFLVIYVEHATRDGEDIVRLISARKATPKERRVYHAENNL